MKPLIVLIFFLATGAHLMSQSLDLTKNVKSFSAAGIPVILKKTDNQNRVTDEIVALELIAHGGVALTEKAGVLQILTHVMTRGTYNFTKEEIDNLLIRTGASFGISPSSTEITISLKCLKKFLPELLPLISELLRVPLLKPEEIELAKSQLMTELKGEQDHPEARIRLLGHKAFYQGHPFYNRPSGYLETVPTITKDDLTSTQFKAFSKENLLSVIVGDLDQSEVTALFEKYFANLPKGARTKEIRVQPNNPTDKLFFESLEAPTSYLFARFKAPSLDDPDYPALHMGLNILDNRLFDEVRTKRALSYSVHAGMGNSRINTAYFYLMSNDLEQALEVSLEEVRKLQIAEVDESLLKKQTSKFLTGWYKARETRSGQARVFALYESLGIGWESSNSFIERLKKVTPAEVKAAMNKYFIDLTVSVVGTEKPKLEPILAKYGFFSRDALNSEEPAD